MAATSGDGSTKPTKGSPRGRRSINGESRSERRKAMLDIAAELFAEQGYQLTTVRQIGDAAGVLSGSLYHHFDSKEAIVDVILSEYFDSLLAEYRRVDAARLAPPEALRELIHAGFRSFSEHRAAITVVQNERNHLAQIPRFAYISEADAEVRQIWTSVIDAGKEAGQFSSAVETGIVYRFLRDSLWVAVRWFAPTGRLSADELADQYVTLVMGGLETA